MRMTTNFGALWLALIALFSINTFAENIVQPLTDTRTFESLTLKNGLKVLLVSDPAIEKSAAAMDVLVGSGDDPLDRQGLAHFLEHMLFLGTQKYPEADEYQDYIAGHGGTHNAYTSIDHTNYFFDVENQAFDEALDRFSQFFIAPLFNDKYVERERNAVHSEFRAKIQSDGRRAHQAFSEIVKPGHALSHFSVGNLQTLALASPRPLRADLIAFYERYYSADRMALVVVANKSIESLKQIVTAKFSPIPKKNTSELAFDLKIFEPGVLPVRLNVLPLREERTLTFSFPVPETTPFYRKKPLRYIGNFVGHEGAGSLLSVLKSKNWAMGLGAGAGIGWRGGELFSVNISLTQEGVKHIDEIRNLLFAYLDLLSREGIEKWRYNEIALVEEASFNYGDRVDPIRQATHLASALHQYPAKDLLRLNYLYAQFDEVLIRDYLSYLRKDNLFERLIAPSVVTDKVSQYYDTPYKVESLKHILDVGKLTEPPLALAKGLALPVKNPFISKDFSIVGKSDDVKVKPLPEKIKSSKWSENWFVNDEYYDLPKGMLNVRYKLPKLQQSAKYAAAAELFASILQEALNETAYNANMGGLGYSVNATTRGLDFSFNGFNDALGSLVKDVFRTAKKYQRKKTFRAELNEKYFERVKIELIRQQQNIRHATPYKQVLRELPDYMYAPYWSVADMVKAYESLTLDEYDLIATEMFEGATSKSLVFGNYSKKQGAKLGKVVASLLPKKKVPMVSNGKVVKLEKPNQTYWRDYPLSHSDSVTSLYLQGNSDSIEENAKVLLTAHMVSTPFYSELRTEKQLGYIVFSADYPIKKVPGILFLVQSPTHNSVQLKHEIEVFLKNSAPKVFASFERDKAALITKLRDTPKSQFELREQWWSALLKEDYTFDEKERLARAVESLTKEEMIQYFSKIFASEQPRLVIASGKDGIKLPENIEIIDSYLAFKAGKPAYVFP